MQRKIDDKRWDIKVVVDAAGAATLHMVGTAADKIPVEKKVDKASELRRISGNVSPELG
ncbi:MAG: hypothetical protein H6765_06095 [Candidatus Peribacteria bacterium]|nr:MAG: hypothetical protein H6765_06095 [Candidatus Peribacteria bacterium]